MLDAPTPGGSPLAPLTQPRRQVTGEAPSCWARMRRWLLRTWSSQTRWIARCSWSDFFAQTTLVVTMALTPEAASGALLCGNVEKCADHLAAQHLHETRSERVLWPVMLQHGLAEIAHCP